MKLSLLILNRLAIYDQNSEGMIKTSLFVFAFFDCCTMGEAAAAGSINFIDYLSLYMYGQSLKKVKSLDMIEDIKQNHLIVKYRSLTYKYLMGSIFVSHRSIIPSMGRI